VQAYRLGPSAWGLQFHAEVTDQDFQYWLDHYDTDEDAVREGIDPKAIARDTAPRMPGWHDLGRGICERFLQFAAER
jgi:GMP synthase-like glutamine amidotransferase